MSDWEKDAFYLGKRLVLPDVGRNCSAGTLAAVEQLYIENDHLRQQLNEQVKIIEYLLSGGDPSAIEKRR